MFFEKTKELKIDTNVVGYNVGWKQKSNIGKKNNQKFVRIPFNRLINSIENKCLKEGIRFVKQEESYTFSGKRIHRGQYQTQSGKCIHVDSNGARNILRKSGVVELDEYLHIKNPFVLEV